MLVMTNLYIGSSNSLPETSYTKMIDIWMIFGLITTFCEVVLHTSIEFLRLDKGDREINHHGGTLDVKEFLASASSSPAQAGRSAAKGNRITRVSSTCAVRRRHSYFLRLLITFKQACSYTAP